MHLSVMDDQSNVIDTGICQLSLTNLGRQRPRRILGSRPQIREAHLCLECFSSAPILSCDRPT